MAALKPKMKRVGSLPHRTPRAVPKLELTPDQRIYRLLLLAAIRIMEESPSEKERLGSLLEDLIAEAEKIVDKKLEEVSKALIV